MIERIKELPSEAPGKDLDASCICCGQKEEIDNGMCEDCLDEAINHLPKELPDKQITTFEQFHYCMELNHNRGRKEALEAVEKKIDKLRDWGISQQKNNSIYNASVDELNVDWIVKIELLKEEIQSWKEQLSK